ncbi:MAG: HD domain-containing protein [Flavisolibacter sp.]
MQIDFQILKEKVLEMLSMHSNPLFAYHSVNHTIDVLNTSEKIATAEGVTDPHQLLLLKLAALYHDTGFLVIYKGHEEESCQIVIKDLVNTNLSAADIKRICATIMATKIPQSPKDHLGEIICDADLDYLGRDDFEMISNNLRKEYFALGIVQTEIEWIHLQIKFIEGHNYFTQSSRENRNFKKMKHLEQLKKQAVLTTNSRL